MKRTLVILLLAPIVALPLALAEDDEAACAAPSMPFMGYATNGGTHGRHAGVAIAGASFQEAIFIWGSGQYAEIWLESNGVEGLQTIATICGPADDRILGAYVPTSKPMLPL